MTRGDGTIPESLIVLVLLVILFVIIWWQQHGRFRHIRERIDSLLKSLGTVSPPVDPDVLQRLYAKREFPKMLGWIKNSMQLDLRVGLRVVHQGKNAHPMWIETPQKMPPFGSAEFRNTQVIVNAQLDILHGGPFSWVVAGFAHELAHVVLFCINHPLQHDEKSVDLTAMILGYGHFVLGAEIQGFEKREALGYLTSDERGFAYEYLRQRQRAAA